MGEKSFGPPVGPEIDGNPETSAAGTAEDPWVKMIALGFGL